MNYKENTRPWIGPDGSPKKHPTAIAIEKDLIQQKYFSFRNVSCLDYHWVLDCNGCFPQKWGYSYDFNLGRSPPHPDKGKSFFFWKTYDAPRQLADGTDNPDYMYCNWENYVLDGSSNYNYQYSIKIIIDLDVPFDTLTDKDHSYLENHTIQQLGISRDTIKTTSVNQAGIYENRRFEDSIDSFNQETLSKTKTESDRYITQCLTNDPVFNTQHTHIIIVLNPGVYEYDPYSELLYKLSKNRTVYGEFDLDEEASILMEVLGPDDETPTDYHRRYLHYRRNECVWGLLDCHCSSSGICLKIENGRGGCSCGFGSGGGKIMNLGTDPLHTLEARMDRLTATEVM